MADRLQNERVDLERTENSEESHANRRTAVGSNEEEKQDENASDEKTIGWTSVMDRMETISRRINW